jgi:hypothetical protein
MLCHYAESRVLFIVMLLSVLMLNAVILSVVMLIVVMVSVVILIVVMLSVVALSKVPELCYTCWQNEIRHFLNNQCGQKSLHKSTNKVHNSECHDAECCYGEYHGASISLGYT